MQFDPLDCSDRYKFQISKIQDGGDRHIKKYKKSPYLGCGSSDFYEIVKEGGFD